MKNLRFIEIIPRLFCRRSTPLQLVYFITSKCNLKCEHCFYAERLNKEVKELSLDEVEKASKGMGRLLWLSLTGGEPFLRKDIAQTAEMFYRNNSFGILTIVTNGTLHDFITESVSDICGKCRDSNIVLYVSIDGLEKMHDDLRGSSGAFKQALGTIKSLKELKKSFKNLYVGTVTTINRKNQSEMKELALFLKDEVSPDSITINMLRGRPKMAKMGEIDIKNYFDFIRIQQEGFRKKELGYPGMLGGRLLWQREALQKEIIATVLKENRFVLPCLAGRVSCVMTECGDIYPCEILEERIGNIREAGYDFKKIWVSKEAKEIRKRIKDTRCFCTYECAITTNILFNVKELFKILGRLFLGRKSYNLK